MYVITAVCQSCPADWFRFSSIDFWFGFVRLTTPDFIYKEASEKRGVEQGYLCCSAEVTNLGYIMSATQATVSSTQVSVKYRQNVVSLLIDVLADNRTTTLGQHVVQVSVNISTDTLSIYRSICRSTYLG